jgi:RNA polymerase sigma-70 factor (ECF subfamily)
MINECRMLLRRQRAAREDDWREAVHAAIPDDAAGPAGANLSLNEMKTLLESALRELPRKYRTVYVLREVQQLSTAETAACLGISRESVKVTLHRAREQLKARLLKSAVAPELFAFAAPLCNGFTARVMAAVLAIA